MEKIYIMIIITIIIIMKNFNRSPWSPWFKGPADYYIIWNKNIILKVI